MMGVGYCLINRTKQEAITYAHVPASKAMEIAGNAVASSITSWYLLRNLGDEITFIPDFDSDWKAIVDYKDMTNDVIDELIQKGILEDCGIDVIDKNEPELYFRKLRNIWFQG